MLAVAARFVALPPDNPSPSQPTIKSVPTAARALALVPVKADCCSPVGDDAPYDLPPVARSPVFVSVALVFCPADGSSCWHTKMTFAPTSRLVPCGPKLEQLAIVVEADSDAACSMAAGGVVVTANDSCVPTASVTEWLGPRVLEAFAVGGRSILDWDTSRAATTGDAAPKAGPGCALAYVDAVLNPYMLRSLLAASDADHGSMIAEQLRFINMGEPWKDSPLELTPICAHCRDMTGAPSSPLRASQETVNASAHEPGAYSRVYAVLSESSASDATASANNPLLETFQNAAIADACARVVAARRLTCRE